MKVGVSAALSERVTGGPLICLHRYETIPSSGSLELKPSNITRAPLRTLWSGPASATGGRFTVGPPLGLILTMHVSEDWFPPASFTVNLKVSDVPLAPPSGAAKVVLPAAAFRRMTAGPAVCCHRYETIPSSESVELRPSRVTISPESTAWSNPELATGGSLTGVTAVMLTMHASVAVSLPLSVTVSWKVRDVPLVPADGAVKVGLATAAFESYGRSGRLVPGIGGDGAIAVR